MTTWIAIRRSDDSLISLQVLIVCRQDVVDRQRSAGPPLAGERVRHKSGHVRHPQSRPPQHPANSAGVMNLAPVMRADRQTSAARYSAPTFAARNDCGVRFRVDRNSRPPGSSNPARVCDEADRIGHMLDHLERGDDRKAQPSASRSSATPRAVGQPAGPGPPRARGPPRSPRRLRRCPAHRGRDAPAPPPPSPAPQPTSSMRGRAAAGISARSARIQPIRAGFIRCSGLIGPSGSHQRAARRSNCATSSAETAAADPCCCPSRPAPVCVRPPRSN